MFKKNSYNTDIFPNDSVTCISPWDTIRILPDGSVKYCDASGESFGQLNEHKNYLDWWQNSPHVQEVRSSMRKGMPIAGCSRCYHAEKIDSVSFRTRRNFQSAIHHGKFFRNSLEQSPIWPRMKKDQVAGMPAFVSVSFNNTCNSRCIMCLPKYSNLVSEDYFDFGLLSSVNHQNDWTVLDPNKLRYQNLLDLVVKNHRLLYLKINGGEPFIDKSSQQFLSDIVESGKTDFNLTINTNGTVWNQSIVENILKLESCIIDFGIETASDANNYIRFGSKIEEILSMIMRYQQCTDHQHQLILHSVPQALSMLTFDTLIDFCYQNNLYLMGNPLYNPRYFSIDCLPLDIKTKLVNRWKQKYHITNEDLLSSVDHVSQTNITKDFSTDTNKSFLPGYLKDMVIKVMKNLLLPEPSDIVQLQKQLISHAVKFDQKHGTNFVLTFPELSDLYYRYKL